MNQFNPKIHHRRSIRLKGYDYSQPGLYFITICCQDRAHRFGQIKNNEMILNEYGQIAHSEWLNTPDIRPNIELGEFVIMPNHMHGIIRIITRGESHSPVTQIPGLNSIDTIDENIILNKNKLVGDFPKTEFSVFGKRGECDSPLRGPSNNIGSIIRGYKSAVTKKINAIGFNEKLWQRNYYENIIRNEQSFHRISDYIINNPKNWKEDRFG